MAEFEPGVYNFRLKGLCNDGSFVVEYSDNICQNNDELKIESHREIENFINKYGVIRDTVKLQIKFIRACNNNYFFC